MSARGQGIFRRCNKVRYQAIHGSHHGASSYCLFSVCAKAASGECSRQDGRPFRERQPVRSVMADDDRNSRHRVERITFSHGGAQINGSTLCPLSSVYD